MRRPAWRVTIASMNTTTTNATSARLDRLAAAICAIASTLPSGAAQSAAEGLRHYAADMSAGPLPAAADEAISANLVRLLSALSRG